MLFNRNWMPWIGSGSVPPTPLVGLGKHIILVELLKGFLKQMDGVELGFREPVSWKTLCAKRLVSERHHVSVPRLVKVKVSGQENWVWACIWFWASCWASFKKRYDIYKDGTSFWDLDKRRWKGQDRGWQLEAGDLEAGAWYRSSSKGVDEGGNVAKKLIADKYKCKVQGYK